MSVLLALLPANAAKVERDSLIVSLITCEPGAEIYSLCGHEAIRIRSEKMDSVWNYGLFSFDQPNFVYRFVKGETDYMVAGYPFEWFMPEYQAEKRTVYEQELNLTQAEARTLLDNLKKASLPENRVYRYNYVKDNCATRLIDRLDEATEQRIIYPDSIKYGTFRNAMRHYHEGYPWYQLGIDVALGSGIDYPVSGREEMFIPMEMMHKAQYAHFEDGAPLVTKTRVLNQGVDARLGPTPWYLSPIFIFTIVALAFCAAAAYMSGKRCNLRWLVSVWYIAMGVCGCVVAFLVFISSHEATSPNKLLVWLNPLQLIAGITVWWRKTSWFTLFMAWWNIVLVSLLPVIWVFQTQSTNIALFPLMIGTVALSGAYAFNRAKGIRR